MELMVSAALFPSLCLCLCCLWCQMRSHWQAKRKVSDQTARDAKAQRSAKGRRFRADELPGSKSSRWGGARENLDSIREGDDEVWDRRAAPHGQLHLVVFDLGEASGLLNDDNLVGGHR